MVPLFNFRTRLELPCLELPMKSNCHLCSCATPPFGTVVIAPSRAEIRAVIDLPRLLQELNRTKIVELFFFLSNEIRRTRFSKISKIYITIVIREKTDRTVLSR